MSDTAALHTPVLLERCLDLLGPAAQQADSLIVDATLGMGGHTQAMLDAWPNCRVVGIDRDPRAIELASDRLRRFGDRFVPHHATYDDIAGALAAARSHTAQAILMDLGVSSLQIDEPDRGFSYSKDAPLDMRMDPTESVTAADVLATSSHAQLTRILRDFGEERYAAKIATRIVEVREHTPIVRSGDLIAILDRAIPAAVRAASGHPAKRTFQALRIAVNRELDILERAIETAIDALAVHGRAVVMSYHSLEDRIVKQAFARGIQVSAPPGLPVVPDDDQPYLASLTRGAIKADQAEIDANPRAASVRLRGVERLRDTPEARRGRAS